MKKLTTVVALAATATLAATPSTFAQSDATGLQVQGFGVAQPSAPNQSLDARWTVHRWSLGEPASLFQINDASGRVLMTFTEVRGQTQRWAIGDDAATLIGSEAFAATASASMQSLAPVSTTAQAPCQGDAIYDDGHTKLVAVSCQGGALASVVVLPLKERR